MLDKSSLSPPELLELAAELEVASFGREEMLASIFTMLELSSMLLERLELAVMFPKMEKLEVLPREKLTRLLELLARLAMLLVLLSRLARLLVSFPIPSLMEKLAAVPHFG